MTGKASTVLPFGEVLRFQRNAVNACVALATNTCVRVCVPHLPHQAGLGGIWQPSLAHLKSRA